MGLQQFYLAIFGLILMQGKLIVRVLLMFCACYLLDVDFVRISPVIFRHTGLFKGDAMFLAEIPLSDFDFFETVNGIFEEEKIIRNGRKTGQLAHRL